MNKQRCSIRARSVSFGRSRVLAIGVVAMAVAGPLAGSLLCCRLCRLRHCHRVVPGRLYRSAQPTGLQYGELSRLGIRRVISLRGYARAPEVLAEEKAACADAGVQFVRIPINKRLPSLAQIRQFLEAVRTSPGPVLVHCQHGKSRTGMLSAAYRVVVEGWPVGRAVREELVRHWPGADAESRALTADLIRRYVASVTAGSPKGGTGSGRAPPPATRPGG